MSSGKCPKCDKQLSEIKAVPVKAVDGTIKWDGAVYTCPYCNVILGAGLDPLGLVRETVKQIKEALPRS